jgi:GNAT superfamily N-acetyltransferase
MDHEDLAYEIALAEEPEWGIIGGGVHGHNVEHAGDDGAQRLCYVLRAPDQEVFGGAIGEVHWEWFCLHLLWVREDLRGRGYGHGLLTAAEADAKGRGAKHAYLDTFSFQAPAFYERHGYRVFGELGDFPTGHTRYYMTKPL